MNRISQEQSDHYMDGWGAAHKGHVGIDSLIGDAHTAWQKGFADCQRGVIDAEWALGPKLERSGFSKWWYETGSGMPPQPDEDREEHTARVAQAAWSASRMSLGADARFQVSRL